MPTDRPMTPEQVAEMWGCSANHVRNLIKRGELRAWRLGSRLLRIPPEAVAEFEQHRQITPSAPPVDPRANDKAESVIAVAVLRAMKNARPRQAG